jgi:hypothetical protein
MGGDSSLGAASKAPQKEKTLDDWLAEEEEEESGSEEETDEEEETEEESEYETDSEEETDDDERGNLIK